MLKQIFSDIRILDFTQVISGSYVTTILGDMGAEIIKVEPPIHGESLRLTGPMYKNESGFFVSTNRNKKSISVNLKDKEGIKLIKELIPHCGVVTQNFKPGVMAKMGLAYDDLKKIKKDIIYLSVSGYGYNNRYTDRPAYDNVIQAETGLAALNGLIDNDQPLRSPLSVSDYAAGMYGAFALSSAIYHHKNTGEGQNIDVAMYDSLISIMDNSFLFYDKMRDEINKVSDKTERDNLLAEKGQKFNVDVGQYRGDLLGKIIKLVNNPEVVSATEKDESKLTHHTNLHKMIFSKKAVNFKQLKKNVIAHRDFIKKIKHTGDNFKREIKQPTKVKIDTIIENSELSLWNILSGYYVQQWNTMLDKNW